MRLAIDCSHHLIQGGIRVYIESLLSALARQEPDHELILHYRTRNRPDPLPDLPEGQSSRLVHSRLPRRLLSQLENSLRWPPIEWWTGKIDVFHSPHFWLPVSRRARLVLSVHDVAYLRHPEYYTHQQLNDYGYRYLLPQSLRRADAVVVPCEHTRHDLREILGVPDEKIWVVPFGSDPRFVQASADDQLAARERFQIPYRPLVIYPVGSFDIRKNLPRTLRAFAQAFPSPSNRPFLFMTGVGAPPPEVAQAIEELHLQEDVRIAEVGYPDELSALMSLADWGLYPSLYEGFGIPALEMLRCGLPLIASQVSSVPEVVGDAALQVDPHDLSELTEAMRTLHDDVDLRQKLAHAGLERASSEAWSWRRAAQQMHAVYRADAAAFGAIPQPLAVQQPSSAGEKRHRVAELAAGPTR